MMTERPATMRPAHRNQINLSGFRPIALFLLLHIPLAILMLQTPLLATVHAWTTIAVALALTVKSKNVQRIAYIAAYIVAFEVLWRIAEANIFWETGKYSIALIFIIYLFRQKRKKLFMITPPLFYFSFLLPSLIYTVDILPLSIAREETALALSGPFSLMVSVWFFSNIQLTRDQIQHIALFLAAPAVSIATLAIWKAVTVEELYFINQSNSLLSGGYGPNQVAAILSLAAVLLFFFTINVATFVRSRLFILLIMAILTIVSIMTFSRGGIYMTVGSLLVAFPFLISKASRSRNQFLFAVILLLISFSILLPYLNDFTNGQLFIRFQDTDLTGRDLIIRGDLLAWREHPLAGTGPGLADSYRLLFFRSGRTHTEFTRLLAEHGMLGFMSFLLLVGIAWHCFYRAPDRLTKAFVVALISWCFMYMAINAMRLAAPSFAFGLATVGWLWQPELHDAEEKQRLNASATAHVLALSPKVARLSASKVHSEDRLEW